MMTFYLQFYCTIIFDGPEDEIIKYDTIECYNINVLMPMDFDNYKIPNKITIIDIDCTIFIVNSIYIKY